MTPDPESEMTPEDWQQTVELASIDPDFDESVRWEYDDQATDDDYNHDLYEGRTVTVPGPRLPVEPLLEATGLTIAGIGRLHGHRIGGRIVKESETIGLTPNTADRLAVACGLTPGEVWGPAWWDLPDGACGPLERLTDEQKRQQTRERDNERNRANRAKRREASAA